MKYLFLFTCFGCIPIIYGQNISPQLISSTGDIYDSEYQVSWTVGELAVATLENGQKLTQGFQQNEVFISTFIHETGFDFRFKAYPNPSLQDLVIEIEEVQKGMKILLHDSQGNLLSVQEAELFNNYDLGKYPSQMFFFLVQIEDKLIETIQIIKNQP